MSDFAIPLKFVSNENGRARLATRGGFEFCVPAAALPEQHEPGESFACPLGHLLNHLDIEAGRGILNDAVLFSD